MYETPKIEPMKHRFKKKIRFRELIFRDDIDFCGRTKNDYQKKRNGKKPYYRKKRREIRRWIESR